MPIEYNYQVVYMGVDLYLEHIPCVNFIIKFESNYDHNKFHYKLCSGDVNYDNYVFHYNNHAYDNYFMGIEKLSIDKLKRNRIQDRSIDMLKITDKTIVKKLSVTCIVDMSNEFIRENQRKLFGEKFTLGNIKIIDSN